jgi:hypothetical protein
MHAGRKGSKLTLAEVPKQGFRSKPHNRRYPLDTISVKWAGTALDAIRHIGASGTPADRPRIGPPMVARSLAAMHTAIYDAWAVYDKTALPTRLRLIRKTGGTDAYAPSARPHTAC